MLQALGGISTPEDSLLLVPKAGNRLVNGRQGLVSRNFAYLMEYTPGVRSLVLIL